MTAPIIDATAWRDALPRQRSNRFDRILVVQCSLDWPQPSHGALREETDNVLLVLCTHRTDLRVERVVLDNLSTAYVALDGDLRTVNDAHAEWMYGLHSASILLNHPAPQIHRLIVGGDQGHEGIEDFADLHQDGAWMRQELSYPVWDLMSRARSTTPLSGYVDLEGPFADTDPSFNL